jgi:hypothetical protein
MRCTGAAVHAVSVFHVHFRLPVNGVVIPLKNMAFPKSKRKHYVVDELPYTACINENGTTDDWGVKVSVAIKAEYGKESLCLIKGMVNRSYWGTILILIPPGHFRLHSVSSASSFGTRSATAGHLQTAIHNAKYN